MRSTHSLFGEHRFVYLPPTSGETPQQEPKVEKKEQQNTLPTDPDSKNVEKSTNQRTDRAQEDARKQTEKLYAMRDTAALNTGAGKLGSGILGITQRFVPGLLNGTQKSVDEWTVKQQKELKQHDAKIKGMEAAVDARRVPETAVGDGGVQDGTNVIQAAVTGGMTETKVTTPQANAKPVENKAEGGTDTNKDGVEKKDEEEEDKEKPADSGSDSLNEKTETKEAPQTKGDQLFQILNVAGEDMAKAEEKLSKAQEKLKEAGDDPEKKAEAQAEIRAANNEKNKAMGKQFAAFLEIWKSVFNGTYMEDIKKKEDNTNSPVAGNDTTPEGGSNAAPNTLNQRITTEIKDKKPQTVEEMRNAMKEVREEKGDKIEENTETINSLTIRIDSIKEQNKGLIDQRGEIQKQLNGLRGEEEHEDDVFELETELERLNSSIDANNKAIDKLDPRRDVLTEENDQLQKEIDATKKIETGFEEAIKRLKPALERLAKALGIDEGDINVGFNGEPIIIINISNVKGDNAFINNLKKAGNMNKETGNLEIDPGSVDEALREEEQEEDETPKPPAEEPKTPATDTEDEKSPTEKPEAAEGLEQDGQILEQNLKNMLSSVAEKGHEGAARAGVEVTRNENGTYTISLRMHRLKNHLAKPPSNTTAGAKTPPDYFAKISANKANWFVNQNLQTGELTTGEIQVAELKDFEDDMAKLLDYKGIRRVKSAGNTVDL